MVAVPEADESICTVCGDGTVEWRNTAGQLHRVNGPAVESSSSFNRWYLYGKYHRLNGPANYDERFNWWHVNGILVLESEFPAAVAAYCKSHPDCPSVAYYMSVTGRFKKPARSA